MNLQLSGKHVLVTGGSRGIGLACVREFAREGAQVSLVGRSRIHLDAALAQVRIDGFDAAGYCADLRDPLAALSSHAIRRANAINLARRDASEVLHLRQRHGPFD